MHVGGNKLAIAFSNSFDRPSRFSGCRHLGYGRFYWYWERRVFSFRCIRSHEASLS